MMRSALWIQGRNLLLGCSIIALLAFIIASTLLKHRSAEERFADPSLSTEARRKAFDEIVLDERKARNVLEIISGDEDAALVVPVLQGLRTFWREQKPKPEVRDHLVSFLESSAEQIQWEAFQTYAEFAPWHAVLHQIRLSFERGRRATVDDPLLDYLNKLDLHSEALDEDFNAIWRELCESLRSTRAIREKALELMDRYKVDNLPKCFLEAYGGRAPEAVENGLVPYLSRTSDRARAHRVGADIEAALVLRFCVHNRREAQTHHEVRGRGLPDSGRRGAAEGDGRRVLSGGE